MRELKLLAYKKSLCVKPLLHVSSLQQESEDRDGSGQAPGFVSEQPYRGRKWSDMCVSTECTRAPNYALVGLCVCVSEDVDMCACVNIHFVQTRKMIVCVHLDLGGGRGSAVVKNVAAPLPCLRQLEVAAGKSSDLDWQGADLQCFPTGEQSILDPQRHSGDGRAVLNPPPT